MRLKIYLVLRFWGLADAPANRASHVFSNVPDRTIIDTMGPEIRAVKSIFSRGES